MDTPRCAFCFGPLGLVREGARFCSQRCGTYYRRRSLPRELTSRPRWVRHDARKRPVDAHTGRLVDVTDPGAWVPYRVAKDSTRGVGLGFVLSPEDDICCIDVGGALSDGLITPRVRGLVAATPDVFMVERSVSGVGIHIWHRGPSGPGTNRVEDGIRVERYSQGRYIAVTGLRLGL